MKYTHIGIEDQAKALKALPTVCQGIVMKPGVPKGHRSSKSVADRHDEETDEQPATADEKGAYDTDRQKNTDCPRVAQPVKSGGGGDRTRVPRHFRISFYVCSRLFDFA